MSRSSNCSTSKQSTPAPSFKLRTLKGPIRRTNDEIHSSIELDPVTGALLDTPFMQRLRGLKQLGTADFVYINVNHNRLEHSLGVAHLAERLCRVIQNKQPQLGCTCKDVLCVKLAGLFHDVGHGPYSHTFEEFVKVHLPEYLDKNPELKACYDDVDMTASDSDDFMAEMRGWRHEQASLMMLDAALEFLGLCIDLKHLDEPLKQIGDGIDRLSMKVYNGNGHNNGKSAATNGNKLTHINDDSESILTSRDFVFIKEAIHGGPIPEICEIVGRQCFIGRPADKEWLYDIVCNRHSGLDVDKIDYFARDERRAFREAGEIDKVMIEDAFVTWGKCTNSDGCEQCDRRPSPHMGEHLMICYPEKMVVATMDFFTKRFKLHSKLYQHKTHCGVARMICDILCLADPHFRIAVPSQDNLVPEMVPISRAMLNARSYRGLHDSVIDQIANTTMVELEPARRLIDRLSCRNLYKCIGEIKCVGEYKSQILDRTNECYLWSIPEEEIVHGMLALRGLNHDRKQLNEGDLFVHKISIHCGQKDHNPVSKVRFLDRRSISKLQNPIVDLPTAVEVPESTYFASIPRSFISNIIRVYCRDLNKADLAGHVYEQWLENKKEEFAKEKEYQAWRKDRKHKESGSLYDDETGVPMCVTQPENEDDDLDQANTPPDAATVTPIKRRRCGEAE
ncbi:hypothetical protein MPSEU_000355400 [Mayamaea pseudoterrestris]|nr:hypothetical protein MPSEU_000355400 [Mayamaea pseudoterrestris]